MQQVQSSDLQKGGKCGDGGGVNPYFKQILCPHLPFRRVQSLLLLIQISTGNQMSVSLTQQIILPLEQDDPIKRSLMPMTSNAVCKQ